MNNETLERHATRNSKVYIEFNFENYQYTATVSNEETKKTLKAFINHNINKINSYRMIDPDRWDYFYNGVEFLVRNRIRKNRRNWNSKLTEFMRQ